MLILNTRSKRRYFAVACLAVAIPVFAYVLNFLFVTPIAQQQDDSATAPAKRKTEIELTNIDTPNHNSTPTEKNTVAATLPDVMTEESNEVASVDTATIEESNTPPGMYIPLKALQPSVEQSRILYEATEELITTCMHEHGLDYIPNAFYDDSIFDENLEPIAPGDVIAASSQGYGLAASTANQDGIDPGTGGEIVQVTQSASEIETPNEDIRANLSADQRQAWDRALLGDMSNESATRVSVESPLGHGTLSWDSESCVARAREQLYESNVIEAEQQWRAYSLQDKVYSAAEEDLDYQTTVAQWQNCMAGYGYNFEHPGAAARQLFESYSTGLIDIEQLTKLELEIAPIEAACYAQSAVGEAHDIAVQRSEDALLIENSAAIAEIRLTLSNAIGQALSR